MSRLHFTTLLLCSLTTSTYADIYSASEALAKGNYPIAVAEFTRLAEAGDASAQANLGYMYYAGEGVPQDYEKAVYWYQKAAVLGNKDAQYNLAVSYAFGEGIKQDLNEAAVWYRRAAEQGHIVSQFSLGISYAYGEGVPQDAKEAAKWFKLAAEQGYARAQVHLGSMYHTGEGVEQDYTEAVKWYRLAADRGDATAQYNLGTMYRSGKGVEKDYAQAKRWYKEAADQGYAAAQTELASLERTSGTKIPTRTIQTKPEVISKAEQVQSPQVSNVVKETETPEIKEPVNTEKEFVNSGNAVPETVPEIAVSNSFESISTELDSKKATQVAQETVVAEEPLLNANSIPDTVPEIQVSESFASVADKIAEQKQYEQAETPDEPIQPDEPLRPANSVPEQAPKIEVAESFSTVSNELDEKRQLDKEKAKEESLSSTDAQKEKPEGIFSRLGKFFSGKKQEETVAENVSTEITEQKQETVVAKLEEKTVTAKASLPSNYSLDAGRKALTSGDYDTAAIHFKYLADKGDTDAQSYLGSLYYVGRGVEQNYERAFYWYQQAGDRGNADAQYSIGNMYLLGEYVRQSNNEAARWYAMASQQGHKAATNNLDNLKRLEQVNKQRLEEAQTQLAEENIDNITSEANETDIIGLNADIDVIGASKAELLEAKKTIADTGSTDPMQLRISDELKEETGGVRTYPAGQVTTDNTLQSYTYSGKQYPSADDETVTEAPVKEETPLTDVLAKTETNPVREKQSSSMSSNLFDEDNKATVASDTTTSTPDVSNVENELDSKEQITVNEDKEKSGLAGFFGKLFSNDKKTSDNKEIEKTEIAIAEPVEAIAKEESINTEKAISTTAETENTPQDEILLLKQQAIQGNQFAQYELATKYYSGNNIDKDLRQAALWYRRSAEQGNSDAQFSLGNMYLLGEGLVQDNDKAIEWYSLAAEQGHVSAQNNLSSLVKDKPVPPKQEAADVEIVSLQEDAIQDETGKTQYEKALAYAFGDGVPQNDRKAFNLFFESAEKGYVPAQYKVAVAFAYGEGVRQDSRKAAQWYEQAAEHGHSISQRSLAAMYLNGDGVDQSKVQALAWYEILARDGNALDIQRHDSLKSELSESELTQSQEIVTQISARMQTNASL